MKTDTQIYIPAQEYIYRPYMHSFGRADTPLLYLCLTFTNSPIQRALPHQDE